MQTFIDKEKNPLFSCRLCPRNCGVNRYEKKGFCLAGSEMVLSKIDFHKWEEPCICRGKGVGAFFFSGCSLHCCFCQNNVISSVLKGDVYSEDELAEKILEMQEKGASAIDLVTPSHFSYQIAKTLEKVKHKLDIPVVWNCGGYEKTETIEMLSGLVDVYMPDFKYFSNETAKNYSNAEDYPEVAKKALKSMVNQVGELLFDDDILKKGVIVRHLVLPKHRHESIALMNWLGENFTEKQVIISLMSQYTPVVKTNFAELSRHITKMEYNSVVDALSKYDFNGYIQSIDSAKTDYIPDF